LQYKNTPTKLEKVPVNKQLVAIAKAWGWLSRKLVKFMPNMPVTAASVNNQKKKNSKGVSIPTPPVAVENVPIVNNRLILMILLRCLFFFSNLER
jgi:hypothetical protein